MVLRCRCPATPRGLSKASLLKRKGEVLLYALPCDEARDTLSSWNRSSVASGEFGVKCLFTWRPLPDVGTSLPFSAKCLSSVSSCFSSLMKCSISCSISVSPSPRGLEARWAAKAGLSGTNASPPPPPLCTRRRYWSETRVLLSSGYSISRQNSLSRPSPPSSSTDWPSAGTRTPSTVTLTCCPKEGWKSSWICKSSKLPATLARKMPSSSAQVRHATGSPFTV
mmetsp:Transcript_6297/g.15579  ORF Transcript_6297/g.15579 Transcript_6297/m.15579 type:complete len:224 (+) Transcript_6297:1065-1736(+)